MMDLLNPLTTYRGDLRYLRRFQAVACLSSDSIGSPMCIRGDRVNGKWRVQTADPTDTTKMPMMGILISKLTPTVGVMQLIGPVENIYTGLDYTRPSYMVGPSGIVTTPPSPGIHGYVWVQHIGKAVASDILFLSGNLLMRLGK